jgi:uncharacterized protein
MAVYRDLIYNNIENFLAGAFPVAKRCSSDNDLASAGAGLLHRHGSESPYFLEISQEFLTFLAGHDDPALPGFCWSCVITSGWSWRLAVAEDEFPEDGIDPAGEPGAGARSLAADLEARLPLPGAPHRARLPAGAPAARPTELVVYRRRNDRVRFMEVRD